MARTNQIYREFDAACPGSVDRAEWEAEDELEEYRLDCLDNLDYIEQYNSWLDGIIDPSSASTGIAIFQKKDSYAQKNAEKTRADYSVLEGVSLSLCAGMNARVRSLLENIGIPWILLLVTMYLVLNAYHKRSSLLRGLQFTAEPFRGYTGWHDLIRVCRKLAVFLLAFYGTILLLDLGIHGAYQGWNASVQSLPIFQQVNLKLTVGQFLGVYVLIQWLGMCMGASVLLFLLWLLDDYGMAIFIYAGIVIIEYLLSDLILPQSHWNLLLYMNLWNAWAPGECLMSYRNVQIPLLGLVQNRTQMLLFFVVVLLGMMAGIYIQAAKKSESGHAYLLSGWRRLSHQVQTLLGHMEERMSYGMLTCYQYLIKKGGILLCILWFAALSSIYQPEQIYYSGENSYRMDFYREWQGPIQGDVEDWMEEQQLKLDRWSEEYEEAIEQYQQGEISFAEYDQARYASEARENQYIGFAAIADEVSELKEYEQTTGIQVWIANTISLSHLFEEENNHSWYIMTLLWLLVLMALIQSLFSEQDRLSGIVRVSRYGSELSIKVRRRMILCMAELGIVMTWAALIYHTRGSYEDFLWKTPIQSYVMFRGITARLSVGQMVLLLAVGSLLVGAILVGILTYLQVKVGFAGLMIGGMMMAIGPMLRILDLRWDSRLNIACLLRMDWIGNGDIHGLWFVILGVMAIGIWLYTNHLWRTSE